MSESIIIDESNFSEKQREIAWLIAEDKHSQAHIAQVCSVTPSYVSQLEKQPEIAELAKYYSTQLVNPIDNKWLIHQAKRKYFNAKSEQVQHKYFDSLCKILGAYKDNDAKVILQQTLNKKGETEAIATIVQRVNTNPDLIHILDPVTQELVKQAQNNGGNGKQPTDN